MTSAMDNNDQDFLSTVEKMKIQELYEDWVTYADCDLLIPKFYSRFIITQHQKQVALSKVTTYDRNDYLHDVVLSRATYSTILTVRNMLIDMARCSKDRNDTQFKHLYKLITMLPNRDSDESSSEMQLFNNKDPGEECSSNTFGDHIRRGTNAERLLRQGSGLNLKPLNEDDEITKLKEVIGLQNQEGVQCLVDAIDVDDEITRVKQFNFSKNDTSIIHIDENHSHLIKDNNDNLCCNNYVGVSSFNDTTDSLLNSSCISMEQNALQDDIMRIQNNATILGNDQPDEDEFDCGLTQNNDICFEKGEIQQVKGKHYEMNALYGNSLANDIEFVNLLSCRLTLHEGVKANTGTEENLEKAAEAYPIKAGCRLNREDNPLLFDKNECQPTSCDRCVKSKYRYVYRLRAYPTPEGSPHGKGLVVFIANFTDVINSHMRDCDTVTKFFVGKLSYEMNGIHLNPCKKQLMLILTDIQTKLNEANPPYDRLVFFWSTRGFPGGYQTNLNKDGSKAELFAKVSTKELTSMFTHDKVPSMKDKPKLFFIQAAANNVNLPTKEKKVVAVGGELERPLDLDILVCHAAKVGTCAFYMPEMGSWFIQNLIRVFIHCYKTEHVLDMITEVNRCIGRKKKNIGFLEILPAVDGGHAQLIDISHNLSYKLYL